MSHFLGTQLGGFTLDRERAAVTVKLVDKKSIQLVLGIQLAKADTLWKELPSNITVMEPEIPYRHIKPSKGKKFYVSTETMDPFHLLMEYGE